MRTHIACHLYSFVGLCLLVPGSLRAQHESGHACPVSIECRENARCVCDAAGNLLIEEIDSDQDGVVDRRKSYTYDAEGRRLSFADDENGDGSEVDRWDWTYDPLGRRATEAYDTRSDGRIERLDTYHYDDQNRATHFDRDRGADGTVDERCTFDPPCPDLDAFCDYVCSDELE